jgi:hypothetical protein
LPALVLLRKPLSGLAKRHIQPERYVQFALKFVEKNGKYIDKRIKNIENTIGGINVF